MPTPRTQTKKEAILQAASKFFSERGYWDTSVSDISKATGVAEGTIFYHFQTKEDLFLAVLKRFKEDFVGNIKQHRALRIQQFKGAGKHIQAGDDAVALEPADTVGDGVGREPDERAELLEGGAAVVREGRREVSVDAIHGTSLDILGRFGFLPLKSRSCYV